MIGYIGEYDATGTNECPTSYPDTSDDGGIRAERGSTRNSRRQKLVPSTDICTWPKDVREYATWAHEHVFVQSNSVVQADIVLDVASVTNDDTASDVRVLAQDAVSTYASTRHHVTEVPYFGAITDRDWRIYYRTRVYLGWGFRGCIDHNAAHPFC
jgi:hypothetical protein